ncbi:sulfatase-like hydrolase/transferase [Sphingomonas sp.]|uniref:sulfatase family protein n=1 Tax=Sphingomonas sp. TaxID=28214 RepID=UPI0025EDC717|nr:sulfatase-like hydrolase/transferase [Sphingomonas sp.]
MELLAQGRPKPARPNILLFLPDQWRHDWVSGRPDLPLRTPNLDRLSRQGVRFNRAVCASPICAPSRACLAAGLEYDHQRTASNIMNMPATQPTFYAKLRDAGYQVLGCGKMDLAKTAMWWGADGRWRTRLWGFTDGINSPGKIDQLTGTEMNDGQPADPYLLYLKSRGLLETHLADYRKRHEADYGNTWPTPLPDDAYGDNWVARTCLELLDRHRGAPWFCQVNFEGPHEPEDITRTMEASVRGRKMPAVVGTNEFDATKNQAIRQNYSAMCENIDRQIGVIWDHLVATGEADNTIVIVSSDHGEMLGDRGRWGKSVPFHASVGVPLVMAGPGIKSAKSSDALVSLIDVAATVLDLAGAATMKMDGRTLRPVLEGKATDHRRVLYSGLGGWRMAWDGQTKLIIGFDDTNGADNDQKRYRYEPDILARVPIVFDTQADPQELSPLGSLPPAASTMLLDLKAASYRA